VSTVVAQVASPDAPGSLYVLTANSADNASTGGSINFYNLGAAGGATLTSLSKISAPHPVAMSIVFLLAP
jgi:hypothetical protein